MKQNQKFSLRQRLKSFSHAIKGLQTTVKYEHNTWIHLFAMVLVIAFGFVYELTTFEWCWITLAIGLVIVTEILNTAIEHLTDLVSPEFHPLAQKTKDAAAGAVLIASIIAVIIGLLVFLPKMN
jgi:diacylglycerol kinase